MKKYIDVEIDLITNSIVNLYTNDIFNTQLFEINKNDFKYLKDGWLFDWITESKQNEVYKLVIENNREVIQGLISISDRKDFVFVNLVECSQFNRGNKKIYGGVAGNLFAYACKKSFELGYNGVISFFAKSRLIEHYKNILRAKQIGHSLLMVIDPDASVVLVKKYFKEI